MVQCVAVWWFSLYVSQALICSPSGGAVYRAIENLCAYYVG
jgi:hypothetical protein